MSDPTRTDQAPAPSTEGAVARLKSVPHATRERLATLIESALARVFDTPYDIRNAYEATQALNPGDNGGMGQGAARKMAEWGAARAATRIGTRYGTKVAGRAVAPLGMAVEFGMSARDGVRELQVLTSFLVNRLRAEGYAPDEELVRRTVLAIYLQPRSRADLRVPLHKRSLAVAKRWSVNTLPLTGRRQTGQTRDRVDAVASIPLAALHDDWRRVTALDARLADAQVPGHVLEARVVERPPPPPGPQRPPTAPPPS